MPVSYEDELIKAQALRDEADKIEQAAFDARPLPDFWRVGQTVRYVKEMEHCASRGTIAYVHRLRETGVPAGKYQVFWTGPKDQRGTFWTTPDDVELVEDHK